MTFISVFPLLLYVCIVCMMCQYKYKLSNAAGVVRELMVLGTKSEQSSLWGVVADDERGPQVFI